MGGFDSFYAVIYLIERHSFFGGVSGCDQFFWGVYQIVISFFVAAIKVLVLRRLVKTLWQAALLFHPFCFDRFNGVVVCVCTLLFL